MITFWRYAMNVLTLFMYYIQIFFKLGTSIDIHVQDTEKLQWKKMNTDIVFVLRAKCFS